MKEPIRTNLPCQSCGSTDSWVFSCQDGRVVLCLSCAWAVACILSGVPAAVLAQGTSSSQYN